MLGTGLIAGGVTAQDPRFPDSRRARILVGEADNKQMDEDNIISKNGTCSEANKTVCRRGD